MAQNEKNFEELYKYSQSVLEEEARRSKRIDDKSAKYLSILTAIIGLYTLLGKQIFADIIPPQNITQWIVLISAFLVMVVLVYAWSLLFQVINTRKIETPSLNNAMLLYFADNSLYGKKGVFYGLSERNKDVYLNNKKIVRSKADLLSKAYKFIALTVILLLVFVASTIVNEWNEKQEITSPTVEYKITGKLKCQMKKMK